MTYTLRTERLTLRPPRPADAAAIAAGLGNPRVASRLSPVPLPYSEDMARDWIASLPPPRPGRACFVIEHGEDGVIGVVGMENELGYWLAEPYWGQGYATEACEAVLTWLFATTDTMCVLSAAHEDNPASLSVQRKLAFSVIGRGEKFSQSRQRLVPRLLTEVTRSAFAGRTPR